MVVCRCDAKFADSQKVQFYAQHGILYNIAAADDLASSLCTKIDALQFVDT